MEVSCQGNGPAAMGGIPYSTLNCSLSVLCSSANLVLSLMGLPKKISLGGGGPAARGGRYCTLLWILL